jgi:RecA-family ATPase
MLEAKVLAAFLADRQVYLDHHHRVVGFSAIAREFISAIGEYYDADASAAVVDLDILRTRLDRNYGQIPKQRDMLRDLLTEVAAVDVSAVNVGKELLDAQRDRTGLLLADAILTRDRSAIPTLLQEFTDLNDEVQLTDNAQDILVGPSISQLAEKYGNENLIKLAPKDLNDRVGGGLVRGQHLLIVALPETGKTLIALNLAAGFAFQGLRVLYIGNEDPIESLALRLMANMSGVRISELFDEDEAVLMSTVNARGYDLVTFAGLAPGSIPAVDALLSKSEYDVVILDQLRNFDGSSESKWC